MNKNNEKLSIITIVAIVLVVLALGYFLFTTAPKSSNVAQSQNTVANNSTDDHHSGGTTVSVSSEELNSLVGKPLPDIQLADKDGKIITSESLKGKATVLFFNEGLMCYPACWNQIAMFGSDPRFDTGEVQAFSVLVDPSKDWQRAIDKMPELAKSKTLFDIGAGVSEKLGLLTLPSSMHRGSLPGHTYIVLDKEGIVRFVKDDPNMAIANDMLMTKIAELNK
jgi:peroxiredoxin